MPHPEYQDFNIIIKEAFFVTFFKILMMLMQYSGDHQHLCASINEPNTLLLRATLAQKAINSNIPVIFQESVQFLFFQQLTLDKVVA